MVDDTDDTDGTDDTDDDYSELVAVLVEKHDSETVQLFLKLQVSVLEAKIARLKWATSLDSLSLGLVGLSTSPYDWKARRGSTAATDVASPPVPIGGRVEPFADLLRYETAMNMRNAADQMQGLSALLLAQRSVIGSASLARGIFEASTWAAALIDPTVSQRERLRRLIMRRIARLMASIREGELLAASNPGGSAHAAATVEVMEDEHGSHLDPAQEIEDLVELAEGVGWKIQRRKRSIELDEALSIDWLVKNLGQRMGVEEYVWGNGSALTHGEHSALTASLVALVQDTMEMSVPGWITRFHATGSWAGPRLLLSTFAKYTGRNHLLAEFQEMDRTFSQNDLR